MSLQRGGMRHYTNQQMVQAGNIATFPENQLIVTSPMNQILSHQGSHPQHQNQV